MQKRQFLIYGIVQGVGFRYFTWRKAKEIGLKGMVRNLHDGSVEAIIYGNEQQLSVFRTWIAQGPAHAKVDKVIEQAYLGELDFTDFYVDH
ncbi:acylphosphatase [Mannheimia massilioguelmaensis]|uniref:acylphosphatase n=1 Tax=Mannheimia massilioguelmaensis TaxID=1604354 RepID=UPI0005C9753E|nr:acylphosphatase [Mannheimia massilioguelmaensis]